MQRKWLEHFCKYRHICEFLGNEGREKEEIKEYLMQELGLPEATAGIRCYGLWRMRMELSKVLVGSFIWTKRSSKQLLKIYVPSIPLG